MNEAAVAQLEAGTFALAILGELNFRSGTQRLTSWGHNIEALGYTWSALGGLAGMSPIQESARIEYPALDLTVQVPQEGIVRSAFGDPADYRRQLIRLWLMVFDDRLQAVGPPDLIWVGLMDQLTVVSGNGADEPAALRLRCEQPGSDQNNARTLRMNDVQHRRRHPGDLFFSRMAAMAGAPQVWLSKRFQRI